MNQPLKWIFSRNVASVCLLIVAFHFSPVFSSPAKNSFSFRLPGDPETFDWGRAHTAIETPLMVNLMEGLIKHDQQMNVVPALAERWFKSADGRVYRFELRKGVKWSDGVLLRAQDFVYAWKRALTSSTAASYAYVLFEIEGAEDFFKGKSKDFSKVGIKALSDKVLEVRLARPIAHFIHMPSSWVTYPLREDIVKKHGMAWSRPGNMVTVGPYVLDSYEIDSKVTLKRNPHFYRGLPAIETVYGYIIKEDSTALNLYETGKLDLLTDISAIDLKRLSGRKDLHRFPYLKTAYLGFINSRYPSDQLSLRMAIAQSIDKTRFPEILHGGQLPAGSFLPEGMLGFDPEVGLKFDPKLAKESLAKLNVQEPTKIPLQLLSSNWEKSLILSQYLQSEFKKNLGLDVQLHALDHKTFRAQVDLGTYSMFVLSWSADFPDPDNFMSVFLSSSGNNRIKWKNSDYDARILLARFLQNPQGRKRLYDEAQKILIEKEAALVPLYHEPILGLVGPRVKFLQINPLNGIYFNEVKMNP